MARRARFSVSAGPSAFHFRGVLGFGFVQTGQQLGSNVRPFWDGQLQGFAQ
jgi:hypothetical protein